MDHRNAYLAARVRNTGQNHELEGSPEMDQDGVGAQMCLRLEKWRLLPRSGKMPGRTYWHASRGLRPFLFCFACCVVFSAWNNNLVFACTFTLKSVPYERLCPQGTLCRLQYFPPLQNSDNRNRLPFFTSYSVLVTCTSKPMRILGRRSYRCVVYVSDGDC